MAVAPRQASEVCGWGSIGQHLAVRAGRAADVVGQRLGDEALAVIGNDDAVDRRDGAVERPHSEFGLFGGKRAAPLAVHAHHLLVAGDDAGFHSGGDRRILLRPRAVSMPRFPQQVTAAVGHAESAPASPITAVCCGEFADVARHVGRAAGIIRFARDVHHRHRRFGRNARDLPPDELIQHEVADHQDALAGEAGHESTQASGIEISWHGGGRPAEIASAGAGHAGLAGHHDQREAGPGHQPVQPAPDPHGLIENLQHQLADVSRSRAACRKPTRAARRPC